MSFSVSVPNVPGVPAVNFSGLVNDVVSLLVGDALSLFAGVIQAPWGIYLGALPVIPADNVVNFSFEQGYTISDYPIEGGLFQSYDKVQFPFTAGFRFTRGGSFTDRQALL
ncbi:MAG: hypothetical protein KGL35_24405, partial [Bradyrhizobium sp.]|nr:hypothetical protein [Bradyrhizobium sp.]